MNKNNLKLIASFLDGTSHNQMLNFAKFDFRNMLVSATNSQMALKLHLNEVQDGSRHNDETLAHKSVIKAMESLVKDKVDYKFIKNFLSVGNCFVSTDTYVSDEPYKYPDLSESFNTDFPKVYEASSIATIDFELSYNKAFILSSSFNSLIHFTRHCSLFRVSFRPQTDNAVGMVKIECFLSDETMFCEALYMGVEYKPKQGSLF